MPPSMPLIWSLDRYLRRSGPAPRQPDQVLKTHLAPVLGAPDCGPSFFSDNPAPTALNLQPLSQTGTLLATGVVRNTALFQCSRCRRDLCGRACLVNAPAKNGAPEIVSPNARFGSEAEMSVWRLQQPRMGAGNPPNVERRPDFWRKSGIYDPLFQEGFLVQSQARARSG